MLTVGDRLPDFCLPALVGTAAGLEAERIDSRGLRGRWLALLYWPKDFALGCPTEIAQLAGVAAVFAECDTQLLAAALVIDRQRLEELPFPVLADVGGELARTLGVDLSADGYSVRATFVADPMGVIRWMSLSDLSAAHSVRELADVLETLQEGEAPEAEAEPGNKPLIRVCAWCRRLHDQGEWHTPEVYIRRRTGSEFTHGICHDCFRKQRMP